MLVSDVLSTAYAAADPSLDLVALDSDLAGAFSSAGFVVAALVEVVDLRESVA